MPGDRPPLRRVLMTVDFMGGVWTYALELAGAFAQSGIEVVLASMGRRPSESQRQEAKAVPGLTLCESSYRLEWMEDPWEDVSRAGRWLLKLENEFQPDIVHLNGYAHAALPWKAPVVVVAHSCVLSWWKAVKGDGAPVSWENYRAQVQAGLLAANLIVAPSRAMAAALPAFYGELPAVQVIPNGRNPSRFKPGVKRPLVLSAGRLWDDAKNIGALVKIAPQLWWPVYVAGEASLGEKPAVNLENLRALGKLSPDKIADWLASAAIFALPARYEPFGLTVVEAALAGCALVLGDIPSLRENWEGAACFVGPDDTDSLRSVLNRLIADSVTRQNLGNRARMRALQFTHSRMAAAYRDAYAKLILQQAPVEELN